MRGFRDILRTSLQGMMRGEGVLGDFGDAKDPKTNQLKQETVRKMYNHYGSV